MRVLGLLAALVLSIPQAAAADPPSDSNAYGVCSFAGYQETTQVVGPPQWTGLLVGTMVTAAATIGHNPVSGTLTCTLKVNGNAVLATSGTGNVVVETHLVGSFTMVAGDALTMCGDVTTTDAHGQTTTTSGCHGQVHTADAVPAAVRNQLRVLCTGANNPFPCDVVDANQVAVLVVP